MSSPFICINNKHVSGNRVVRPSLTVASFIIVVLSMIATGAHAAAWESLIMPGPLSEAHLELEEECSACHTAFSQIEQNQLCRDCHEDVAADVEQSTGFHGKHPDIPTMECRACHSDHLGRDVDPGRLYTRNQFGVFPRIGPAFVHRHKTLAADTL